MSDQSTPGDFNPDDLHPDEIPLDPDYTSEILRLRRLDEEAAADAAAAAETAVAEAAVEHDVDVLLAERDSFRDIALRLQADFDNYRKRISAQQAHDVHAATGKMAEALLPVLDACEAAFVQHPAEVEPLFNLLLGQLKKLGLETMHLDGAPFDPNLAEAVLHEEGDEGAPVVSEVLRSGYTWQGKVLRAAMVKVRG